MTSTLKIEAIVLFGGNFFGGKYNWGEKFREACKFKTKYN